MNKKLFPFIGGFAISPSPDLRYSTGCVNVIDVWLASILPPEE